jgi:putative DNA methylase
VYVSADDLPDFVPDDKAIRKRIEKLCADTELTVPNEPMPKAGTLGFRVQPYGVKTWGDLYTPRQMRSLLSFVAAVREMDSNVAGPTVTYLAAIVDRLADFNSSLCVHNYFGSSRIAHTFGRHALPMVWDFAEANPFCNGSGGWGDDDIHAALSSGDADTALPGHVSRSSATSLPYSDCSFDAVLTDPPYYDNVPYADISDYFYVWLKRTVGHLYREHFATELTPKKAEAIAEWMRHGGSNDKARRAYEGMMAQAFRKAHRVLKTGGELVVVYAHKTTLGWATLVDALRQAGFTVTEAWPIDTEKPGRLRAQDSAALASSIDLVARKREGAETGNFEEAVKPELEQIVRERVRQGRSESNSAPRRRRPPFDPAQRQLFRAAR